MNVRVRIPMKTIILFGASSTIAQAYVQHINDQPIQFNIVCISASELPSSTTEAQYTTDYSSASLTSIINSLKKQQIELHQVVIFNGQLHYQQNMPEKKLEDLESDYFNQLMTSNTLTPLLCLQSLLPLLKNKKQCTITALSARVGSINDNKLGGWYSYRASKAALNMLFQTAAIELARRAKNTKLIVFHPGTTDTELSKPFQRNVPEGKLFTPAFVAERLYELTNNRNIEFNGESDYIDWKGDSIAW